MSGQATIVVGMDGSDSSRAALEFALEEAVRRGAAVRLRWAIPEIEYWPTSYGLLPALSRQLRAEAEKSMREMVDAVAWERGGAVAAVPIEIRAVAGLPGEVLVSEAEDADLLVVGHRAAARWAARYSARSACNASCTPRYR